MLLTSCSVAFRGDNTRSLLLSDLFMTDVMMNAKGLGETVPVSLFLVLNNIEYGTQQPLLGAYYAGGQCQA
jgi:hypothetical protein